MMDEPAATRAIEEAEMFIRKVRDYLTARGLLSLDP
jgi:hypothetical protein